MNIDDLRRVFGCISATIADNRDYLIQLDQQNGDGDLGITMTNGFNAVFTYVDATTETDLGKVMMRASSIFNETSPSTLGTITSVFLMAMAKSFRGRTDVALPELVAAFEAGVASVMAKAGSKPGEKTVLDAVVPAVESLRANIGNGCRIAFLDAAHAAKEGSEATRGMRSVHGRAAYYGDRSIGVLDGGSVMGRLVFESLSEFCQWERKIG